MGEEAGRIVKRNNRLFSQGIRSGDLSAIEQLYADDSILMPPNNTMVTGRKGSREFWSAAIKMGLKEATLSTIEVHRCGDEIREVGSYKLRMEPERQRPFEDVGKYLTIWRQGPDGSWKLEKDIWNSDLPKTNMR